MRWRGSSHGSDILAVYHAPELPGGLAGDRYQSFVEKELAIFGNVNYSITDKLKATAGVRVATNEFDFFGTYIGPPRRVRRHFAGNRYAHAGQCERAPGDTRNSASTTTSTRTRWCMPRYRRAIAKAASTPPPRQPVAALPWRSMAALRQRPISPTHCGAMRSVRSCGCRRAYRSTPARFIIDWSGIQTNVPLPGCFTFVENAAKARSQRFRRPGPGGAVRRPHGEPRGQLHECEVRRSAARAGFGNQRHAGASHQLRGSAAGLARDGVLGTGVQLPDPRSTALRARRLHLRPAPIAVPSARARRRTARISTRVMPLALRPRASE